MAELESLSAEHCHKTDKEPTNNSTRNTLVLVSAISATFLIAELVGGIVSNSLAILTDVAHLASDVGSFLVSLVALWLAKKPPSNTFRFGYHRAEIFGAIVSILTIWIVTVILVYLAAQRIIHGQYDIEADAMLITSSLGIVFNIIMGILLHLNIFTKCSGLDLGSHGHSHGLGNSHGHSHGLGQHRYKEDMEGRLLSKDPRPMDYKSLRNGISNDVELCEQNRDSEQHSSTSEINANLIAKRRDSAQDADVGNKSSEKTNSKHQQKSILLRAAFIHIIGDLLQSIGVFIAAVIIKCRPDLKVVDPICTFLFSLLVIFTTINVLKDVFYVLMEAVPPNIDLPSIKKDMQSIKGVKAVHNLQVWALTVNKNAAAVHLAVDVNADQNAVLKVATGVLRKKYDMHQSHVQTEKWEPEIMTVCEECVYEV